MQLQLDRLEDKFDRLIPVKTKRQSSGESGANSSRSSNPQSPVSPFSVYPVYQPKSAVPAPHPQLHHSPSDETHAPMVESQMQESGTSRFL